jgi:hypothetical protein
MATIFIQELESVAVNAIRSRGASYVFDPPRFDERLDCLEIGFLRFDRQGGETPPVEGYFGRFV